MLSINPREQVSRSLLLHVPHTLAAHDLTQSFAGKAECTLQQSHNSLPPKNVTVFLKLWVLQAQYRGKTEKGWLCFPTRSAQAQGGALPSPAALGQTPHHPKTWWCSKFKILLGTGREAVRWCGAELETWGLRTSDHPSTKQHRWLVSRNQPVPPITNRLYLCSGEN